MRRSLLPALCASLLLLCGGAAPAADRPPLPDFAVADRLVPEDPMPERETRWVHPKVVLSDVVYEIIPGFRPLHLDLYQPVGDTRPRPLIVFLHGGAWAFANPRAGAAFRNLPSIFAHLVEAGYVVASVEFRFSGEAPFPAQVEDTQAAIRFLRANGARLGIDGTRVGLWGMSGGAYLAAMAALNCAAGACVQGWVGWFGLYDFRDETAPDADLRHLLRCGPDVCTSEQLDAVSPIVFADGRDPPALLVHGTADNPEVSQQLADRLHEVGASADLLLIPDVSHGFVGPTEAATKAALRQGLTATFDFFDRVLQRVPSPRVTSSP